MARRRKNEYTERDLTKGQLRKLYALRKSLGDEIANRAFADWMKTQTATTKVDKNIELIEEALLPLIEDGRLRVPRGGYLLRRGRGRVIVERISEASE